MRKILSVNIADLRNRRDWSQVELAQKSGVKQTTISAIERAQHSPRADTLEGLAHAFGCPTWALLLPGLPDDATLRRLDPLLQTYRQLPPQGRAEMDRVAEAEARYATTSK